MEINREIQPAVSAEPEDYQQKMLDAWKKYTHNQELDPIVSPLIAASWRRCWGHVNPNKSLEFTRMSADYLLASQTASFDLIAIARPVMEDVYQCIQDSGTAIILTNSIGCVLDLIGDDEVISIMNDWGAGIGSILSEELIGTTSIGLALTERMPVQVAGREHFVQQLHVATGAAAPMFDISGRLLGVLGIVMPVDRYHIHSLGLIAAAARAIEGQRQSDFLLVEQNSQLAQLNAIISKISDGILVWNVDYVLIHANSMAGEVLGIPVQSMMGKHVDSLFVVPGFMRKAILRKKTLTDVEGVIKIGDQSVNCLISLDFVYKSREELQWIIVTLRPEKKVRQLVQRQVGANAALTLDDIPGESPQMQKVRSFVRSAAGGAGQHIDPRRGGDGQKCPCQRHP
jgi:transcriptional regulator of acetoin/glycerol metabolism